MDLVLTLLLLASQQACEVSEPERQRQIALDYEAFDSVPPPHGWRALNEAGCTDAAITLLNLYRSSSASKLTLLQRLELPFHMGQTLAFAGRDREAALYFEQADAQNADEEWRAYVAAHIAFFRRDQSALTQARSRYAAASKSDAMRLKIIDGFLACPDKSYMVAAHCRM